MYLRSLKLQNFRSYKEFKVEFGEKINLILGKNAIGKTNILEAIYLLSGYSSFRKSRIKDQILHDTQYAIISAFLDEDKREVQVKSRLIFDEMSKNGKKEFYLNNKLCTRKKFSENLKVISFVPDDVRFLVSSPTTRRDDIDAFLCQIDWKYHSSLCSYNRALRQRNVLMELIRDGRANLSELGFWDNQVVNNGTYLQLSRESFLDFVNVELKRIFEVIKIEIELRYYKSLINPDRISDLKTIDIKKASTSIGPHRDDFIFFHKGKELGLIGSRGQHRISVLALKYCMFRYMREKLNRTPVLILDDIFSEFDTENRTLINKLINQSQTIITSAEPEFNHNLVDAKQINL